MADTTTGGSCLENLTAYVKTQKGFILAAEIVSSPPPQSHFWVLLCNFNGAYKHLIRVSYARKCS